ncbi:MAG: peptide chain release factor N(5)-glutamine methyltransferase [Tissierellales bacterium]|nr:peptide chain release factor N(5)-glutamine methyltransferase [Tissierellales bacterium]MBN2828541.1 peptide chain release factor N(5)-glutamine methyltransferase [Tissierellales bacterium]
MVTIRKKMLEELENYEKRNYSNPLLDIQLLMAFAIGKDRIYVMTHPDEIMDEEEAIYFSNLIQQRNAGRPIQYILEKQEFMGLDFIVREGVLIPRPDTESLVENIIKEIKNGFFNHKERIRILDIGTGSGAIGLSLAYYINNADVTGIDFSETAVNITLENQKKLGIKNYCLLHRNIFDDIWHELKGYDVVVSNPPYIPSDDIHGLQPEVSLFEPLQALDGGLRGLDFYDRISKIFSKLSNQKSILAFEHGHDQSNEVIKIVKEIKGINRIEIIKDLSGHSRGMLGFFDENAID